MSVYTTPLSDRHSLSVSKYKDQYYIHISDSKIIRGETRPKSITLHAEALLKLEEKLPEILDILIAPPSRTPSPSPPPSKKKKWEPNKERKSPK